MIERSTPTFQQVLTAHRLFVRRTLRRFGVPAQELDDVAQEVAFAIHRSLASFDPALSPRPDSALAGWIHGICERQAASYRRARRMRAEVVCAVEALDRGQSDVPSSESRWMEGERTALLLALLAAMESGRRDVLIAYELEELPMPLVARELSIPLNTAWNRLRLGRADLRAAWRRRKRREGG